VILERKILLSILVITHNQEDFLHRCVDSILKQRMEFQSEIIISDDGSSDSTWNIIQDYMEMYPDLIYSTRINSSDYNPKNNSQRSGYNRCNAYKLARGKYIVHVDADDYLLGTDVYSEQVKMLEKHPECSLCMQNVWVLNEGSDFKTRHAWFPAGKFQNERIISANEFIIKDHFIINQAFVMRRNPHLDPVALYGKRYVDSVITYHHLQFGNIVFLNRCDYVYTKHPEAITGSLPENDKKVLWCLAIYIPLLIPRFTGLYYSSHLQQIIHVVNLVRKGGKISDESAASIRYMGAYIYDIFSKSGLTLRDTIRLNSIRFYILLLIKLKIRSGNALRVLHCLMVSSRIDKNARFSIE